MKLLACRNFLIHAIKMKNVFFILLTILIPLIMPCPPPDVPFGGSYVPTQKNYLPADKVQYSCKDRFTRIGKDSRYCQTNGKWSGSTPFCDSPTKIKNPRASSDPTRSISNVVDGSPNTCYISRNATSESLEVFLDEPNPINVVRLYLLKGKIKIEVLTVSRRETKLCGTFDRDLEENQWIKLECPESLNQANSLRITDISPRSNVLAVCEIEVYAKDDVWCKEPPEVFIPNGRLEVSRDKATLMCAEGFKAGENTRLVCDKKYMWTGPNLQCDEILCDSTVGNYSSQNNVWQIEGKGRKSSVGTYKQLKCSGSEFKITGKPERVVCQRDGTWSPTTATCIRKENEKNTLKIVGIAVGVVVVLLIFSCLGLTLYCIHKQKEKQVVIVYKSGDEGYSTSTLKSMPALTNSEGEYSTVYYEATQIPPFPPPRTLPHMSKEYTKPADNIVSTPKLTKNLPADIAFGTLKSSTLYGK